MFDVSVCQIPSHIARPVQSRSLFAAVWMRNEALRRQLRLLQITTPYSFTTDTDFSWYSYSHRSLPMVQHVHLHVWQRPPNRRCRQLCTHLAHGRIHRALCWSIDVEETCFITVNQLRPHRLFERFT